MVTARVEDVWGDYYECMDGTLMYSKFGDTSPPTVRLLVETIILDFSQHPSAIAPLL